MNINLKQHIKTASIIFLFIYSSYSICKEKLITYKCTGLSQFELIGSSGVKKEVKINVYNFVDGMLQDLNNIQCDWTKNNIQCESNFLNVRKLSINLNNNEVSDYISGNKGFGVYIESFKGKCELKK